MHNAGDTLGGMPAYRRACTHDHTHFECRVYTGVSITVTQVEKGQDSPQLLKMWSPSRVMRMWSLFSLPFLGLLSFPAVFQGVALGLYECIVIYAALSSLLLSRWAPGPLISKVVHWKWMDTFGYDCIYCGQILVSEVGYESSLVSGSLSM